jgi:hypothetical protein
VSSSCVRIRIVTEVDTVQSTSGVLATAREKWEPIVITPQSWSTIDATAETWTPIADTAEIWTEVA